VDCFTCYVSSSKQQAAQSRLIAISIRFADPLALSPVRQPQAPPALPAAVSPVLAPLPGRGPRGLHHRPAAARGPRPAAASAPAPPACWGHRGITLISSISSTSSGTSCSPPQPAGPSAAAAALGPPDPHGSVEEEGDLQPGVHPVAQPVCGAPGGGSGGACVRAVGDRF